MIRIAALALALATSAALAVEMVADEGGLYRVVAPDGLEVSQHTRWHKAAASATRAAQATGEQHTIEQALRIRVTPEETVQDDPATEEPVDEEPVADDPVDEEPVTEPGDSEIIVVDQSKLTEYPDPTTLDIYKDYPAEEPKPDGLDRPLAEIAEEMEPGEWRRLPVDAQFWNATAWSDKATWDSERQQLAWVGTHGSPRPTKWVMWDVDEGVWHRQTGDELHPYAGIHSEWGYRSYGHYTQLADGSDVYARFGRLWKQGPETLEWSAWTMIPGYQIIGGIEYFPDMGVEGSVIYLGATSTSGDATKFMAYDIATSEWRRLPKPDVQGRHSLMRYNAVRNEVLLLGGDQSYRTAQALRPDGSLKRLNDIPRNVRIMSDQLCADPVSGHYLVMATGDYDDSRAAHSEFFGLDSEANEWYVISQWADRKAQDTETTIKHEWAACAAIPEMGVTIWPATARGSVSLYKHEVPQ